MGKQHHDKHNHIINTGHIISAKKQAREHDDKPNQA
jgi:hypothetical protein